MRRQPFRGDPETKIVSTREDFSDGVNMVDSDDYLGNKSVRYLKNFDLEALGDLQPRKGWKENVGLNYLLELAGTIGGLHNDGRTLISSTLSPNHQRGIPGKPAMNVGRPNLVTSTENLVSYTVVPKGADEQSPSYSLSVDIADIKLGDKFIYYQVRQPDGNPYTPQRSDVELRQVTTYVDGSTNTHKLGGYTDGWRDSVLKEDWKDLEIGTFKVSSVPNHGSKIPVSISYILFVGPTTTRQYDHVPVLAKVNKRNPADPNDREGLPVFTNILSMSVVKNEGNIFERFADSLDPEALKNSLNERVDDDYDPKLVLLITVRKRQKDDSLPLSFVQTNGGGLRSSDGALYNVTYQISYTFGYQEKVHVDISEMFITPITYYHNESKPTAVVVPHTRDFIDGSMTNQNIFTRGNKTVLGLDTYGLRVINHDNQKMNYVGGKMGDPVDIPSGGMWVSEMGQYEDYTVVFNNVLERKVGNYAYKPSPLEAVKKGFNVLGTLPLTWLGASASTADTIQGLYIGYNPTDPSGGVPDGYVTPTIPRGSRFTLNFLVTGTVKLLDIKIYNGTGANKKEVPCTFARMQNYGPGATTVAYGVTPNGTMDDEVEVEVNFSGTPAIKSYYYFPVGDPKDNPKKIEGINVGKMNFDEVWDRIVYYEGATLWYSDSSRFDYVPHYNYINLNISPSDRIMKIIYFRNAYMIFTKEKIFKLEGHFDPAQMRVEIVSDVVGCIAPHSIKMVGNQLIFLSSQGLKALKSESFKANMENIEDIGEKINPFVVGKSHSTAFVSNGQYMLFLNDTIDRVGLEERREQVEVNGTSYDVPDVIRYYTETKAFAFDIYKGFTAPEFIFDFSGELYAYKGNKFYQYESSTSDFDEAFETLVETGADNMTYPMHEKKFKKIIFKLGKEAYQQTFYIDVYADGVLVEEFISYPEGDISEVDLANSRFIIREIRLPSIKCKNLSFELRTDSSIPTSIKAVSYVYKIGKIRR